MKKSIVSFIITLFLNIQLIAQDINIARLDSLFALLADRNLAMSSLTISRSGNIQYQKEIGYSFLGAEQKRVSDSSTKYRIGSATKMFTAVMIFQLAEENKIALDQKLSNYFPNLPAAKEISISQMLSHRSGLHDYTKDTDFQSWMDMPKTHEELIKIIQEKGSDFKPGKKADYSNSNYLLLGYIIEKILNKTYKDAVQERIISRLKLKNTYFGNTINIKNNEAFSYKYGNNEWSTAQETDLSIHGGAGSLVSTTKDLVKFIDALFSYQLISKSSLIKMKTMIDGYGMGLFPDKYGTKPSLGHNGRIEEFYTAVWYFPGQQLSIAYCTNGISYPREDLINSILKICFNEPFAFPFSKNLVLKKDDLDKYSGKYLSGEAVVNCSNDGHTLSAETRGKVFELEPVAENYFMHSQTGYFFEFVPAKGVLEIKETDNKYIFTKGK